MRTIHRLIALLTLIVPIIAAAEPQVLLEAEAFDDYGGWSLDTQFVHIMGSPYLLAHGLGVPVKDAITTLKLPATGTYKVFVRTKDWVARWKAPGQPGKFQLLLNGKPLAETFGTRGADWGWQEGGTIDITNLQATVALHDLTGFDGRCDAILFTKDIAFTPPNDDKQLAAWRKKALGLPDQPIDAGSFDLVILGGGYAGVASAVSAARMGITVALVQDRPVLGGNGSSEVRVWSQGFTSLGKYSHLGEIVEQFADNAKASPGVAEEFGDDKKEAVVRAEKNITLYLNCLADGVEMKDGKVAAVSARNTRTGEELRFTGKYFDDCTGHAVIGALAGADYEMAGEGHMGMSNMWRWAEAATLQPFPDVPWALDLTMDDFPYPRNGKAEWFWEGGFFRDPIKDLEYIRDWNLRAAFGAFNAMKNKDGKDKHPNAKIEWLAYIGGNRESRLLRGDMVLTKADVINKIDYPDGTVPTTWSIDIHIPKEQYAKKYPEDPFISKAVFDGRVDKQNGYPIPYRCFYSRNVPNLFMAGRDISVDREALGTIRVMRTCGMMGEVVGKAASICVKHDCLPRDVYSSYLEELKELLNQPGNARRATVNDVVDAKSPLPEPAAHPVPPRQGAAGVSGGLGGEAPVGLDPAKLAGIVIDDTDAKLTGDWTAGTGIKGFVGKRYLYDTGPKGKCSARFEFKVPAAGQYEVRLAYAAHENRASKVPVAITSAEGEKTVEINQKVPGQADHGFVSLGTFRFDADTIGAVVVSNKGADGHVSVDAVQVVAK